MVVHCNIVPLHQICMYVCMYVCTEIPLPCVQEQKQESNNKHIFCLTSSANSSSSAIPMTCSTLEKVDIAEFLILPRTVEFFLSCSFLSSYSYRKQVHTHTHTYIHMNYFGYSKCSIKDLLITYVGNFEAELPLYE